MRFLIVAAAVFACAAAAPSGALLAAPYASGIIGAAPWGVAAPLAAAPLAALPTIPPGDIQGAAIDAQVAANDNNRAVVDAVLQGRDQAAELQGRAINAAESHAWQAVNAAQTAQAAVDGAAAGIAPVAARSLVAPSVYAAPAIAAPAIAAPAYAARAIAAPVLTAPGILGARAYAAPGLIAGSQSISTQSLSQTHPAPLFAPSHLALSAHGW